MDESTPRGPEDQPGSTTIVVGTGGAAVVVPVQTGTAVITSGGVSG